MKLITAIFRYLYVIFVGGLTVYLFYAWFLLPVFTQLPELNYWQAIGISSFLYLFNQLKAVDLITQKTHEKDDMVVYGTFLIPWIVIGLGFITHLIITNFSG
jgi:hypothetical protein